MFWLPCHLDNINCTRTTNELWKCTEPGNGTSNTSSTACSDLADNDISGKGVLVAFFATAIMTVVIAWMMLIFNTAFTEHRRAMSVLDRRFVWSIRKLFFIRNPRRTTRISETAEMVLQKMMIALSDVHLLAGLGILIAGWIQACHITIYHYHAVIYLAWVSCSVHMVALSISRDYLQRHKSILIWRLVLMSVLFVLLFLGISLTASKNWPTHWVGSDITFDSSVYFSFDTPAVCTWDTGNMKRWRADTVFALIILTVSWVFRVVKLFETSSKFCRLWTRVKIENKLKAAYDFHHCTARYTSSLRQAAHNLHQWLILATYLYLRALYDIIESELIELVWVTMVVVWGFAELFTWSSRSMFAQYENQWSFGQVLPLLLVVAPLAAIPEMHHESKIEAQKAVKKLREATELHDLTHTNSTPIITPRPAATTRSSQSPSPSPPPSPSPTQLARHNSFWTEAPLARANSLNTVHTGVPLLDQERAAYRSFSYNLLIGTVFVAALALFAFILVGKFIGGGDTSNLLDDSWWGNMPVATTVLVSCILGPGVSWFCITAPLSRIIRRTISNPSYQPGPARGNYAGVLG